MLRLFVRRSFSTKPQPVPRTLPCIVNSLSLNGFSAKAFTRAFAADAANAPPSNFRTVSQSAIDRSQMPLTTISVVSSSNNCIMTVSDSLGNVLFWHSAGRLKYGSKESTSPLALKALCTEIANKLNSLNRTLIALKFKGGAAARRPVVTAFQKSFQVASIEILSPIPFNGCKRRHARRI